ncbi:hypothetical protein V1515DRAFT_614731 [Lipomyces mesembrius]
MSIKYDVLNSEVLPTEVYDPTTLGNALIVPALAAMINSFFAAHFVNSLILSSLTGLNYYNGNFWEGWGDARRLRLKQWKENNKDAVHTQWEITAVAVRYSPEQLEAGPRDEELKRMVRLKKGFVFVEETVIPAGILGNLTRIDKLGYGENDAT